MWMLIGKKNIYILIMIWNYTYKLDQEIMLLFSKELFLVQILAFKA